MKKLFSNFEHDYFLIVFFILFIIYGSSSLYFELDDHFKYDRFVWAAASSLGLFFLLTVFYLELFLFLISKIIALIFKKESFDKIYIRRYKVRFITQLILIVMSISLIYFKFGSLNVIKLTLYISVVLSFLILIIGLVPYVKKSMSH